MTIADDAQPRIDAYLKRVRKNLRGVAEANARDIVEELRSHIVEKASVGGTVGAVGVDAAIASLGSPEELAHQYVTDDLLARAESSRSPLLILNSLLR